MPVSGVDVTTTVTLQTGVTVSGRLVFDGDSIKPPSDLTQMRVALTPTRSRIPTLGVPSAVVDATGAFTFRGVAPGRYRIMTPSTGGWLLRSAVAQGRDMADLPLEIASQDVRDVEVRFTDRPTEVSGDLLDATGHPATEVLHHRVCRGQDVLDAAIPEDSQSTRPASDGHFTLKNLPPGEYYIGAVTDVEQGEWYDPSFLAQFLGASQKITLAEGEKKVQSLKIAK